LHRLYRNSGATVVIAAQVVQVTIGVAETTKAVHTSWHGLGKWSYSKTSTQFSSF
jgi:hypothetical protein